MSDKIVTVSAIAVIIAVVAASCVIVEYSDDDGKKNYTLGDPESDFTLLDSPDKIVPGLTLKNYMKAQKGMSYGQYFMTAVVDSVADGKATYSYMLKIDSYDCSEIYKYAPGGVKVYGLDYKNAPYPDGISVELNGDAYMISGTWTPPYYDESITYNMAIYMDGADVIYVGGNTKYSSDSSQGMTVYETQNDVVWESITGTEKEEYTVDTADFYDSVSQGLFSFEKYDADDYAGTTITEATGKCGNVNCTIYTINGKVTKYGNVYEDYKLYVYDGYVIQENGLCDGVQETASLSIFIAS